MTRQQRIRRGLLLCCHFARNAAFYRAGLAKKELRPDGPFWRTVNGNFLNIAVLEWCKLFADKKGKHCWTRLTTSAHQFKTGLLDSLEIGGNALENYCEEMREYRDRFVAHLDSDQIMKIPELALALDSADYLYWYLLKYETEGIDTSGFPTSLQRYRREYSRHAAAIFETLRAT